MRDEEYIFKIVFEDATTISILAGITLYGSCFHLGQNIYALYAYDVCSHLFAIRSDILNGSSTHFSWYQRKVFKSVPALFYTVFYDIIPNFSAAYPYNNLIIAFLHTLNAFDGVVNDVAGIMWCHEQQVATPAYREPCLLALTELLCQLQAFFL